MTRDNRQEGANSNETTGFNRKPITIELNDRTIDAAHHITGPGDRLLHLYIDTRKGGIDVTVPLASDKPPYARSETGRWALGIDTGDQQQERELVADDGREVPACTCGADLLESAELETDHYPVAGAREPHPRVEEGPAATCGECGEHVGALYGMTAVIAVWEARGESLPGNDDTDDDETQLVADGGRGPLPAKAGVVRDEDLVACPETGCERMKGPSEPACAYCVAEHRREMREREGRARGGDE